MPATLSRTALVSEHVRLKARMVPFAGWEMPVQYAGIIAEHKAVRSSWGIFDVSHMGRIALEGSGARALLSGLVTADIASLKDGKAKYALVCREDGGILDDVVLLRRGEGRFLLVCNASNSQVVLDWVRGHVGVVGDVAITDHTLGTVMIAAQGPLARERVDALFGGRLAGLKRFSGEEFPWQGTPVIVSRTGYTGEDGFELIAPAEPGAALWRRLLEDGAAPCGLGARDTLRLEAGLLLHGQDMDVTINPIEAGLDRFVHLDGAGFVGKAAIVKCLKEGLTRKLIGFRALERGPVPRTGFPILENGKPIGRVTSGAFSPSLEVGIGLGYVPPRLGQTGMTLQVDARGKAIDVQVVEPPFYRRP